MRPAPAPAWGQSYMPSRNPFGSGTFGIRDQLQRSKPDYFNLKTIRGSSPAASLAADLSQNFRIDNEDRCVRNPILGQILTNYISSPRFPTPRRALFTSNMMDAMENRGMESATVAFWAWNTDRSTGYITTPPLPATSSPAPMDDVMDISPLPQKEKEPFFSSIEITSPTPIGTPADDMMVESPIAIPRQSSAGLEPPKMLFAE